MPALQTGHGVKQSHLWVEGKPQGLQAPKRIRGRETKEPEEAADRNPRRLLPAPAVRSACSNWEIAPTPQSTP